MFLVKSRDIYMLDGRFFQLDVSFNPEKSDNYDAGYYLVISEITKFVPKNKKDESDADVQIEKMYTDGAILLLDLCEEESEQGLENAMIMREHTINNLIDRSEIFFIKSIDVNETLTVDYSKNGVIKKPKETMEILDSLYLLFKEELESRDILISKNNDKPEIRHKKGKNSRNSDSSEDTFKPVEITNFTFNDVAGLKEVKEELEQIIDFINNPSIYEEMGAEIPKGILLYGPPGTGKTLLAKAMAGETTSKLFQVSGSEFVEKYVGVGAKRVRELFATAKKHAPSIIFIDEIDAIGSSRNSDREGEHNRTLNQLLVELDGFKKNDNVVVMASTNMIDSLDNALTRAGRLGEHIYVGNPDYESRKELFNIHTRNKKLDESIDLDLFAKKTHGFNGADIKSICNNAALLAVREKCQSISNTHFEKAFDKVVIGLHSKTKKMIEDEKKIVAYHEAGHALANLEYSLDTIEKVSILPRGTSLGLVYKLPNEDKYLSTREQLMDRLKVLLAGRISEEIFFEDVTNGASNDLKNATEIALRMVREYAMCTTDKLLVATESKVSISEKERAEIILKEAYAECRELLLSKKDVLETIATNLLDKEEMNGDELKEILSSSK